MKTIIDKEQLKQLILNGISSEELNSKYDYSQVTNMNSMFYGCSSLKYVNPLNFHLYNFVNLDNEYLKKLYPEIYI